MADPPAPESPHGRFNAIVVRHGETEWSAALKHTSRTDVPLTPKGRRRAHELAAELAGHHFALVLCSPLRRARETAELAGFHDPVIDPHLREWDYGECEGLTTDEIRTRRPGWNLWRDGCPGGETPEEVGARADRILERLLGAGGDALIFAHGHILRVLTARWLALAPGAGARFALAAGSLGVLGWERETEVIQRWNAGR
ncbi:MAG TPA: histidine phosphatase family protein [Solirubrobacteraceae bacterium]|nr:histidine phosphatase family protein [Solirubrobacteraceae bacterium]